MTDIRWVSHPSNPGISAGITVAMAPYDNEGRHICEPFGFYEFAWRPRKCRNGKWRWLCWVESHDDGTFTLGNRAH